MKAKNLLEGLERYDGYAVCPGCQGCEGKKVIACRDLIRQAAARDHDILVTANHAD